MLVLIIVVKKYFVDYPENNFHLLGGRNGVSEWFKPIIHLSILGNDHLIDISVSLQNL